MDEMLNFRTSNPFEPYSLNNWLIQPQVVLNLNTTNTEDNENNDSYITTYTWADSLNRLNIYGYNIGDILLHTDYTTNESLTEEEYDEKTGDLFE